MIKNKRLYLDIHAIQTLPPSNVNRDDTGSPKTAQYGGVRRARVSSQAWKKSIRQYFYDNGKIMNVGVRTLDIVTYVSDKIMEKDSNIDKELSMDMAEKVINGANIKTKDQKARALFFLGDTQAEELADAAIAGISDKKILKEIIRANPAIDIALFGRMVADDPSLNEDASSQVAHSISTHAIENEFDFYTALDDLSPDDNAGAGMLGNIEFNSSTLYRYANVAVHELVEQLEDKNSTIRSLKLFIEAFANSMPTGKINSFANQTLPQVLIVSLRDDRPINLVSAFEEPVKSSDGYVRESIEKLGKEYLKAEKFSNKAIDTRFIVVENIDILDDIGKEETNLSTLTESLTSLLDEIINVGD